MKKRHKEIVEALKNGARLWRYSTAGYGYLILDGNPQRVKKSTIDEMEEIGIIEEDMSAGYYRAESGSDLVYKLKEKSLDNS